MKISDNEKQWRLAVKNEESPLRPVLSDLLAEQGRSDEMPQVWMEWLARPGTRTITLWNGLVVHAQRVYAYTGWGSTDVRCGVWNDKTYLKSYVEEPLDDLILWVSHRNPLLQPYFVTAKYSLRTRWVTDTLRAACSDNWLYHFTKALHGVSEYDVDSIRNHTRAVLLGPQRARTKPASRR